VIPTLTDGVVTLRRHGEDDLDRVLEQSQDPLSIAWTVVPVPYTREDAKQFVRHAMPGGWESDQEWGFAVEHEGRYAGTVSLRNRDQGRAEIAFGAHPEVRGQGVMSRALRLLLEWGFSPVSDGGRGVETVAWLANRGNWASRRLAWSLGFTFDGTLRGWLSHRGQMVDAWAGTLRRGEPLSPATRWLESPTIHGERVVLRALDERDLPRVVETLNDPETQRWHQRPREQAPHTVASQSDFVLVRLEQAATGSALHWAVAEPGTGDYLGQMSLFSILHRREASLSYWTHPDARGRGLTKQAAQLVVRHCFVPWEDGGLGLRRLWSDAELGNGASRRVLESVGFVQTGVDRASEPAADGTWADQARYDLLGDDVRR
jgi:RimJ/RimL family protein N-acetyltransferase